MAAYQANPAGGDEEGFVVSWGCRTSPGRATLKRSDEKWTRVLIQESASKGGCYKTLMRLYIQKQIFS